MHILFYILSIVLLYFPLLILDMPFIVYLLVSLAIKTLPIIGPILELIVWIWSFVVVVSAPIDGWAIAYFVAFAFYFFTTLLPFVINAIYSLSNK